jgi:hypothetical protein
MGGRGLRGWWWVAGGLVGCAPNSGSQGTSAANTLGVPDSDDATAGTSDEVGTTVGVDTSGTEVSSGPESTSEPMPTTGEGMAVLAISDGPVAELGDVAIGGELSYVLTVTNDGDVEATGLSGAVGAPFAMSGGFPGAMGSCGGSLGPGDGCTVEVVFAPGELGRHRATLTVSHDAGEASRDVAGGAIGQTENLLENAGGETEGLPPPGWTVIAGEWTSGAVPEDVDAAEGSGYFYAGTGPNNTDFVLRQDVDVSAWASTADAPALRISFSGQARGWAPFDSDEQRIRVHYLDGRGAALQVWTTDYQDSDDWQAYAHERVAPVDTRTVRVELNCRKDSGMWCNAYFDALELRASYP